jgi:cobalt-zinc-cadmium efflux system membrane fusion protein
VSVKPLDIVAVVAVAVQICTLSCAGSHAEPHRDEQRPAAARGETCARHGLAKSECFICDPALRDAGRLWCTEHERYEDRCFICHPELRDPERPWCEEHKLYEDECFFCHPELRDAEPVAGEAGGELVCNEHRVLESECGICHPELAASLEPGSGLKVRLESTSSADKAGIEIARPAAAGDTPESTVLARVTHDLNHFARVTPLAGGVLRQVLADIGQTVSRNDHLATVSSSEIARLKSEHLLARAQEDLKLTVFRREQELVAKKVSAQQEYEQARAEYEIARTRSAATRQQLVNFGLSKEAILRLEETGVASSDLRILAPFSGTIVERDAVPGEAVTPGDALFKIADLSSMWLELSIPEDQISLFAVNQTLVATFASQPGLEVPGTLTWIGSSVDEESRHVKARAAVANRERRLRHGMFARAHLSAGRALAGLTVPAAAVQHIDGHPFVFVRLASDLFELRRVALGMTAGARAAITAGLGTRDEVVVSHSFTLKSELLKSRLGAGCVDE